MMRTSPRLYRRTALRAAAVCLSVLVTVFGCDTAYTLGVLGAWRPNLYLDAGRIPRRIAVPDDDLGYARRPRVSFRVRRENGVEKYRMDEYGFRNPPGLRSATIVFIGDSYTEAGQVSAPDTFVQRIAAASGFTVANLGRSGYGPQQELIVLRKYGLAYSPRTVVWELFDGNDLSDAVNFVKWRENPRSSPVSMKDRYLNNSPVFTRLSARFYPYAWPGTSIKIAYHDGTVGHLELHNKYTADQPQRTALGFAETTRAIEAGYRLCQSRGIQLLVIFMPTMLQVLEPYILFDRASDRNVYLPGGVADGEADFGNKMAEFCTAIACPFLNVLPVLRRAAIVDNRRLYIQTGDEHLDVWGHQAVAQAILEWLRGI